MCSIVYFLYLENFIDPNGAIEKCAYKSYSNYIPDWTNMLLKKNFILNKIELREETISSCLTNFVQE